MSPEQWSFVLAMVFKPFAALLFLWVAMKIARVVMRAVPSGKLRRVLLTRLNKRGG